VPPIIARSPPSVSRFSRDSGHLLLCWPRSDRDPRNEWRGGCCEACALSTVLHAWVSPALGAGVLAGLSSQWRMHREDVYHYEREDHARRSVDRRSDHRSIYPASALRRRLVMRRSLSIAAAMLLLSVAACNRAGTERSYAVVGDSVAALRAAFNADAGKVRVLMVASPTCGACLEGATEVSQQVAAINQGKTVPLYVLWVPRQGGREKDVPAAFTCSTDPRLGGTAICPRSRTSSCTGPRRKVRDWILTHVWR
jgi:hypothetical protein